MATTTEIVMGEQALERSQWCRDTAEAIRDQASNSVNAALASWAEEWKPEWLTLSLLPGEHIEELAERLQAEGYKWAEIAGTLAAEDDGFRNPEEPVASSPDTASAVDRIADYFVGYLFERYPGTRHVRRVATWLGFLLKAIERIAGDSLSRSRSRQLVFDYRDHRFKARYDHHAGARGGIQIVEVLPGRGAPESDVVLSVTSLAEAEEAYHTLQKRLDAFVG